MALYNGSSECWINIKAIKELAAIYNTCTAYTYIKGNIFMNVFVSIYFKITELNLSTKMLLF